MLARIGFERAVIVRPSSYPFDIRAVNPVGRSIVAQISDDAGCTAARIPRLPLVESRG